MSDFKIFVEGVADKVFIRQCISAFCTDLCIEEASEKNIIQCDGRTNLWSKEEVRTKLQEAIDNNVKPLIIFDADNSADDTRQEIDQNLTLFGWQEDQYHLFLFPNNQDPGDLETLLELIIPDKNRPILDCWYCYENKLKSYATPRVRPIPLPPLTTPARKTKIYGYLEALLGESKSEKEKIKEKKREYNNPEHWDLNSVSLSPLREFLKEHL